MRRSRAMKDIIKKFTKSVESGETKAASDMMSQVHKAIDKAAKGGVIKANTASRKKSRLAKRLKAASAK